MLVVLVIEVCSFAPWRVGKGEQEGTRDEMVVLDSRRLDVRAAWVAIFGTRSSTFPALAWEERAANGTSQEFLLDSYLVWIFLACSSPLPPNSVGSKEPPPPCSTSPGPKNARGDCDIGMHEHGFVFEEQSLQGGRRAARWGQAWPSQRGFLLAGAMFCFSGMSSSARSPIAAESGARGLK